jgi:hypothetical protein
LSESQRVERRDSPSAYVMEQTEQVLLGLELVVRDSA